MTARQQDQPDDFGAHENPSDSAIATRPAKASDIRYAVMPASHLGGSTGGSPGRVERQYADREGCVTMVGRRPIQKVRIEKARGRFPGAGFFEFLR
jgi:hypothetical protein